MSSLNAAIPGRWFQQRVLVLMRALGQAQMRALLTSLNGDCETNKNLHNLIDFGFQSQGVITVHTRLFYIHQNRQCRSLLRFLFAFFFAERRQLSNGHFKDKRAFVWQTFTRNKLINGMCEVMCHANFLKQAYWCLAYTDHFTSEMK